VATAIRTTEPVEKTITVEEERYTLTLNKDEARALYDVLRRVGGNPDRSRRGHAEAVYSPLSEALGLARSYVPGPHDLSGSLAFHERTA
jgi:hypothetical protein